LTYVNPACAIGVHTALAPGEVDHVLETIDNESHGSRGAMTARPAPRLLLLVVLMAAAMPSLSAPISRNVGIVIERLPDEAEKCGLTETLIRDRLASVLAADKWTVDPSPAADFIYVSTNLFFVLIDTHCVYNVSVELKRGLHADDGRRLVVATSESGRLGIMSRSKSSTVIVEDIEESLKGVINKAEAEGL
jgi:hypothetical protein